MRSPEALSEQEPLLAAAVPAADAAEDDGSIGAAAERGSGQGGTCTGTADQPVVGAAQPPAACRICLSDEDPAGLETPCGCAGSMAWAHHGCVQRWIDEKHGMECEVCGQRFRGAFRTPPPRPPPVPLVAQLQIDNADNRIVLLADPESGAIVARVVVPPGGDLPEGAAGRAWAAAAAAAAAQEDEDDEDDEEGSVRCCGVLASLAIAMMLVVALLGAFSWMSSDPEGPGADGAAAGAWFVRIMLLTLWIFIRSARPGAGVVPRRLRPRVLDRRRLGLGRIVELDLDLEAGQQPARRQQPHTPAHT